jgi:hypothetical protein
MAFIEKDPNQVSIIKVIHALMGALRNISISTSLRKEFLSFPQFIPLVGTILSYQSLQAVFPSSISLMRNLVSTGFGMSI